MTHTDSGGFILLAVSLCVCVVMAVLQFDWLCRLLRCFVLLKLEITFYTNIQSYVSSYDTEQLFFPLTSCFLNISVFEYLATEIWVFMVWCAAKSHELQH